MKPFFLLTTPRSGGTALCRMLDGTEGIRCAGESMDLLPRLREMERWPEMMRAPVCRWDRHASNPEGWSPPVGEMIRGWVDPQDGIRCYGLRSSYLGVGGWEDAVGAWSWLLERMPDATLIFLRRRADEAAELSLEATWPLWIPRYGGCNGGVWRNFKAHGEHMRDFHTLNPRRTVLLEMEDVFDLARLNGKLERVALAVDAAAWAREAQERHGDRRLIREDMEALAAIVPTVPTGEVPEPDDPKWMGDEMPADPVTDAEILKALMEEDETSAKEVRQQEEGLAKIPKVLRLPIEDERRLADVEVHTLRWGGEEWMRECAPTLERWCGRHGYRLRVWDGEGQEYPAPKFQEVEMLEEFLKGEAEWLLYVDADVYVHPAAPALPDLGPGMWAMPDVPLANVSGVWPEWVATNFPGERTTGWVYRNAGVWLCDRPAAAALLAEATPPYIEGQQEQHQFNVWMMRASRKGMKMGRLPAEWNMMSRWVRAGWFHHLAGRRKPEQLKRLRGLHLLPPVPEDFPRWDSTGGRAVAYLWTSRQARWNELRFSLRSVLENLREDVPIHIFADRRPKWLGAHPRIHVHEARSYADALAGAVQIADEVLLMNDDIYLLKPLVWDDFRTALTRPGELVRAMRAKLACSRAWTRGVGRATASLHHERGMDVVEDFSTHTPYLFERGRAIEVLETYGCWWKMPFETLYHNHHGTPRLRCGPLKVNSLPPETEEARYLNHGGEGPDEETCLELERMFPRSAPWETDGGPQLPEMVWLALDGEAPHVDEARQWNPEVKMWIDDAPRGATGEERRMGWRAGDLRLLRWWEAHRAEVQADHVIFCEWDVRFAARVSEVFPRPADLLVAAVKDRASEWVWWEETDRLPKEMQQQAAGISPLSVVMVSRRCLDAMLAHPKRRHLEAADVFCEVRFPTWARVSGYEPKACKGLWNVKHAACAVIEQGVSHPVKSRARIDTVASA